MGDATETQASTYVQRLLRTLVDKGQTQEQIATALGVTQATVSRMLSGEIKSPRWDVMDRLRALVIAPERDAA